MTGEERDQINMKKATEWAVHILKGFLNQKQNNVYLETCSVAMPNDTVCEFYASVQVLSGWQRAQRGKFNEHQSWYQQPYITFQYNK